MNFRLIKTIFFNFLTILKFVNKKNKFKYAFLHIQILFSSVLETLSIFTIIPIIESFNNDSDSQFLKFLGNYIELKYLTPTYLILCFCLFLVLSNLYLIIIKKKIADFSYVLVLDLQKKLFNTIIRNKYAFFINKNISHFNNIILHEAGHVKGAYIESSLFILSQIFLVTFTFVGLMIYDYRVTFFLIAESVKERAVIFKSIQGLAFWLIISFKTEKAHKQPNAEEEAKSKSPRCSFQRLETLSTPRSGRCSSGTMTSPIPLRKKLKLSEGGSVSHITV